MAARSDRRLSRRRLVILRKEDDAGRLIARLSHRCARLKRCAPISISRSARMRNISRSSRAIFRTGSRISRLQDFQAILRPISQGDFNTLSAAYAVWALKGYSQTVAQHPPELSINEIASDKQEKRLTNGTKLLQKTIFDAGIGALRFRCANSLNAPGAFFQVVEAGFDRVMPEKALTEGLEVYRELLDKEGKPVARTQLGEPITIRLRVRSLRSEPVTNGAVIDLLPGGFEVVGSSLQPGVCRSMALTTSRSGKIAPSSLPRFRRKLWKSLTKLSRTIAASSSSLQSSRNRCTIAM